MADTKLTGLPSVTSGQLLSTDLLYAVSNYSGPNVSYSMTVAEASKSLLNYAGITSLASSTALSISSSGRVGINTAPDTSAYLNVAGDTITQAVNGSSSSSGNLTLRSTTHATKGFVYLGGAQTTYYDDTNNYFTVRNDAIGGTASVNSGINLINLTAAALGAQQVSPTLTWEGQGWGTTAGTSQSTKFQIYISPVQGATASSTFTLASSNNGGAFSNSLTVSSAGTVTAGAGFTSGTSATSTAFTSNATIANANFQCLGTGVGNINNTKYQFAGSSTIYYRVLMGGNSATTLGVGTSYAGLIIGTNGPTLAASGAHALLSSQVINPVTYTNGTGATATNTASLYINGAASVSVTGVNYALWSAGGVNRLDGITMLGAATTSAASLNIASGTAPTTPNNGDIWFDGTNLKMQVGGVTKTFTLV